METPEEYKYYSYDKVNKILYHEVTTENFATQEEFVMSMSYFASLIETYHPRSLIIKILKKPDLFELTMKDFMKSTIYKAIHEIGIKKIAFFVPDKTYYEVLKIQEQERPVPAKIFSDLDQAKSWIAEPN